MDKDRITEAEIPTFFKTKKNKIIFVIVISI